MEISEKQLEMLNKAIVPAIEEAMEKNLKETLKQQCREEAFNSIKDVVQQLRIERALYGFDRSGLIKEQKELLVEAFIASKTGNFAAIEKGHFVESPETGGLFIPTEVYAGIMRVAESYGHIMRSAFKFPMAGTSELTVPKYTGSHAQWNYLGEDEEETETNFTFGNATLNLKTAIRIIRVDNRLLKQANQNLADWIIAILAESLAYTIDYQGFRGTGLPFTGLLSDAAISVVTMGSGDTGFANFDGDYASDMIVALKTGARSGAAFYMHASVWGALRKQKDSNGDYVFKDNNIFFTQERGDQALQPLGTIHGYPVYDAAVMPALADTAVSTKFVVFGNLKYFAFGEGGSMEVSKSEHASVSSKNVFAAYQTAFRTVHEHALAVANEEGFVVCKTAAS